MHIQASSKTRAHLGHGVHALQAAAAPAISFWRCFWRGCAAQQLSPHQLRIQPACTAARPAQLLQHACLTLWPAKCLQNCRPGCSCCRLMAQGAISCQGHGPVSTLLFIHQLYGQLQASCYVADQLADRTAAGSCQPTVQPAAPACTSAPAASSSACGARSAMTPSLTTATSSADCTVDSLCAITCTAPCVSGGLPA